MVILVMGTTGAGKTTVGRLIALKLGWIFLDADDFHPPANIEKMKHGIALTDLDRAPWLANIHARMEQLDASEKSAVLACSALKQSYRETLAAGLDMRIVYLRGTYAAMREHILARHGHFAGESILAGQFSDLEEPADALVLDVSSTPEKLASAAIAGLGFHSPESR